MWRIIEMEHEMSGLETSVKAKSGAFGNYIDPQRELFDAPQLSLVRADLPEYANSGLGRVLLSVMRYEFTDLDGKFGVEGMSVGADSSRGIMVYRDMQPEIVAQSHATLHERNPDLAEKLRAKGYPPELISIGVLRASDADSSFDSLCRFIDVYHARASWIETHPVEVRFANLEVMAGGIGINWERVLPIGPTF